MAKASPAMDAIWALRRRPDPAKAAECAKALNEAAAAAAALVLPARAADVFAKAPGLLKAAAGAAAAGKLDEASESARDALWIMSEDLLAGALRVEPEPRCGTPLVYDSANQAIVMFGGRNGLLRNDLDSEATHTTRKWAPALNDTWVYDCKTRQWRELECKTRPPATELVHLALDERSGLIVLAGPPPNSRAPSGTALYALDVRRGEWSLRLNQPIQGLSVETGALGLDPAHGLLVLVNDEGAGRGVTATNKGQETWAMKLDMGKLPAQPLAVWEPPPAIVPRPIVPDDPAWVAKLGQLPANVWVRANPKREPARRDYGNLGVDPARGWAVHIGGGHSTYQINDVAIYMVGANRWSHHVGNHNDGFPPVGWEGSTLGYRGGVAARHMYNMYQAFDGRLYRSLGSTGGQDAWGLGEFFEPGFARFYDIGRGGAWRESKISRVDKQPAGIPDDFPATAQMVDPDGRIVSLEMINRAVFRCYDIESDTLTARAIPPPKPLQTGVRRQFCYLAGQNRILWCEYTPPKALDAWVYDIKSNAFTALNARRPTPGMPAALEYVETSRCAMGVFLGKSGAEQWVYSLEKNDWAPLEIKSEPGRMSGFHTPYAQMVWVARYGVFVNRDNSGLTWVMRPDLSQVKWDDPPSAPSRPAETKEP